MKKSDSAKKKPSRPSGALTRLAAKAMKLVKPAKKAAGDSPKPAKDGKKVAKPVAKPTGKTATMISTPASTGTASSKSGKAPAGRGATRQIAEEELRRMSDADYMNDLQLEFFRSRLLQMRQEVLAREVDVKERLNQREVFADPADRATAEEEHWLDLRLRERESLLLRKIDDALRRIKEREYGYCEVTGEPIGIPRLLARPTATVCVDVKGQNEQIESQYRDR